MAKENVILTVGGDTKSLDASLLTSLSRAEKAFGSLGKSGLGNISKDFTQFDRSLDSSTARVLAFSLSAGAIIGVQRAFSALVRETIAVDRSMKDINVIFNLSTKNLTSFGSELFKISRDTGQNFSAVADAAKELSRQGLSVSETLQRTKDSLVLVRQSGLDAGESVKAITVALNSFNKEALTSSDVINKLASVDARYAVSSADLADALSRVGSTASDAGVSFNELLGVVTAVQQITGRSGSVIGNSLKSIFTRVSRADVIDQLRELGVAVSTSQNGIQKLEALASALKTATPETANVIKELAGGVYQINAVAAALNDLGSNYSITARATRDAANASNEAYIRNEALNKSYEALINRTGANLRQIGSGLGNLTVGPALEKILGTLNTVLEAAVSKDGNNVGEIMAKGLIKGFGEFISGPGLAVVVYGIGKLLARFTSEAATGFKTILGLNEAAKQRVNIEVAVSSLLKSQPELIAQANTGLQGQLAIIQKINAALLQQQGELAARATATSLIVNTGISRNLFRTKAVGHIPEAQEKMGAYTAGYKPGNVKEMNVPDLGRIIYNDAEKVKYFPGMKQPAIIPPQTSRAGKSYKKEFEKSHGFDPYKNEGLIPNFAGFIGPTKRLLQGLKQAGIPVNRTKEGSEFKFPFSLNIQKGNKESSPVFDLFHEAGHYQAIGSGLDKIMKRPQGQAGLALAERLANTTALDLMSKTGFDSNLIKDKFKPYAQKNYDTYRKNQSGKFIKNIPSSPFSRGDLEFLSSGFSPYANKGLVPNYASRFGPTKTQPIRLMDILHSGQFSQKQRQVMSYTADGEGINAIASKLRMNPQEVEFIQKQMTQTLAKQFADIKKGRMSLSGGLVPSFAKKFQPSVQLGRLIGRGSYKDIYNIQSFQPDLFGGLNIDPKETVAGILRRKNIKDFEKQEQLFKYGAPVPQIYGYEDVLAPTRYTNNYKKKNAAIIERIEPFSEGDARYIGTNAKKHEGDVIRNISGVLAQYLKAKGYVDSYRKAFGWGRIQGDLTLRNLGVKRGFSRGQALDELGTLAQLNPLQKIGAGDVKYIDSIVENSGLSIADVGYLNPRKANSGLIPNYANPKDRFLSFLSQINPSYVKSFRGIQKQDQGLAGFIRNSTDLRGADAQRDMASILGKKNLQYTPSKYGLETTSYFNLDKSPKELREQISGLFSKFGKEIPNFSALTNAISREASAGIPKSQIRIGKSPTIVSPKNPLGLGVYNTIDEPGGLNQGINRALREGQNPKTYGVPNFAPNSSLQYTSLLPESQRKFTELAFNDLIKRVKDGTINFSKLSSIIDKFASTHQVAVEPLSKYIDSLRKGTALEKKLQDKTSAAIRENIRNTLPFQTQLIPQRKPLLIGYSPSPPNPATQGTQLGFPGFGSQDFIDKQAQLNTYRDQALQRQVMIQNVRQKYQEKLYNDRIIAQQKQNDKINGKNKEGFFNSGRGQNLAIGASLILPIAAGAISESIGTSTIGRRGAGQTVQSLANIGSYGALGASFGPQGAIAGLGLGALLETPRIIKAFTDRIPDLDREIEKLTENINATNDGFSSIIQTSEKLNAFARGDLTLTPQQFLNQKQSIGTNLASLAGKNPNFSTDIGRVFSGGNISEQSELLGRIQSININKKNRQELERLGETISPSLQPSVFKTLKNTFSQLTSLATSFSLTPINTSRLFNQKTGNFNPLLGFGVGNAGLSKEEQTNLKDLTRSTVFQTNDSGKSIASYLIDRFRNNPEDKDIQAITGAIQKLGNDSSFENRDLLLSRLEKAAGGVGDIDIEPFKRILLSIGEKGIETIVSELQSSIGPRTIRGLGSFKAPDVIKNLRDSGNLLRPIQDLFQNINQIGASFQARGQQNINTVNNRLAQESFSIQSDAGIRAGRVATSSPLQALDIQLLANQRETKLQERGELEKLNFSLEGSEQGSILKFLNQLQQQTLSEKDNSKREKRVKDFDTLLKRLLPKSKLNASGTLGDAIGALGGETRQEFFQNVRKELESNREQLSTFKGELGGLGYNELQDYQESLLELLQSEFDITLDYNTKKKDILEKISNAQRQNIEQDRQKREQIVQGIVQQYSSIIKDVDQFSNDIRNILEKNKNLTGFKAIRANELGLSRLALAEERKNYSSGDIAARDLRPLVSDVAKKQLRNDGSVSRESLNDIFKSSFGYNKQDLGQDLISDMEGIRDALTSIRPAAKDAFASMVDGSKSASDAFRQFGVSIATNVLNNVAKLAFDNLFGNLFNNNTFGAIGSLFSAKSSGGIVGYAGGGMVTGGSGVRDDVPAMLANGAYVIKKSSVNKYGSGFLSSLNSGRGFAGGGINQILKNDFVTTGRKMGIKGSFDVDPRLSVIGQTDENNPSNNLKFGREQDYYGYLNTIENYKKAVKQFEAAKTQRLIGAYVSGIINIGGAGISSYKNNNSNYQNYGQFSNPHNQSYLTGRAAGGLMRYAGGGSVDSIPALLTGGEFVMSPQTVNRMGVGFMNRLNSGQISPSRYATGGFVGRDINAASPVSQNNGDDWQQINASLLKLIQISEEMRDLNNGTKNKLNKSQEQEAANFNTALAPSVNITINMTGDKVTNTQTQNDNTENNSGQDIKKFAELMKSVALETIISQQRPNGLLSNTIRK